MKILPIVVLILCLSFSTVHAFDEAKLVTVDQFEDLEFKATGVKLNNFSIDEKTAFLVSHMKNIAVSFSARNKLEDARHFSVMLVGMSDKQILWSMDLEPLLATISPKKTESVSGSTYVSAGTLSATQKIWIRVVGDI